MLNRRLKQWTVLTQILARYRSAEKGPRIGPRLIHFRQQSFRDVSLSNHRNSDHDYSGHELSRYPRNAEEF